MSRRVLEVVASSQGGGAVHVRDLSLALSARGWQVTVVMPEDGVTDHRAALLGKGISVHDLPIAKGLPPLALCQLRNLAAQADLVHVHGARAAMLGRLAAASLAPGRPRVIYTVHGFAAPHYGWPRRWALLATEAVLSFTTDEVIAVSEAERIAFARHVPCARRRVTVVRNGIDADGVWASGGSREDTRRGLDIPEDVPVVITVCRLYRPRDFPTLLQAFALVARTCDAHLLIAGDGPFRASVQEAITRLGLQCVHLLGYRQDVHALLRASDLFVLSTAQWEGLPLTILEAMAAGLPVVASRVGGIGEAVEDGVSGRLVVPSRPDILASAIVAVLKDPTGLATMGRAGQRIVHDRFTLVRQVDETEALYRSALGLWFGRP